MENKKITESTGKLFTSELKVINVGLQHFADTLRDQGVRVEQVEWQPPGEEDQELNNLLDAMGTDD